MVVTKRVLGTVFAAALLVAAPDWAGAGGLEAVDKVWAYGAGKRRADVELPVYAVVDPEAIEEGTSVGRRFPDVRFRTADGTEKSVSDLTGGVRVVHYWGSWCGGCKQEMPDIQVFHDQMAGAGVDLVMLNVKESYATGVSYLKGQGHDLPACEGLSHPDIASRAPKSYILDRNGIVVYAHFGKMDWKKFVGPLKAYISASG